jgi:hypothetical protein
MRVLLSSLLMPIFATTVFAADRGMVLCPTPAAANNYWSALAAVSDAGAPLTKETVLGIARKNECKLVISEKLKPIKYMIGIFEMTDGTVSGFATPQSYVLYVNRPKSN